MSEHQCTIDSILLWEGHTENRKIYDELAYRTELIQIIDFSSQNRKVNIAKLLVKTCGQIKELTDYTTSQLEDIKAALLDYPLQDEIDYHENQEEQQEFDSSIIKDRFGIEWYLVDDEGEYLLVFPVKNGKPVELDEPVPLHPAALHSY